MSLVVVLAPVVVNSIGITGSVVVAVLMTSVEVAGLVVVVVTGVWYVAQGDAGSGVLADISVSGNPDTPLLVVGLVGNLAILGVPIDDARSSLVGCTALVATGVVLFLIEYAAGSRNRPPGTRRGDPEAVSRRDA